MDVARIDRLRTTYSPIGQKSIGNFVLVQSKIDETLPMWNW